LVRREQRSSSGLAARFLAPVVFLAAVTIAVLIVRSGLSGDDAVAPPGTALETRATTTTPPRTTTRRTTPPQARRSYAIEAGDTLETIAAQFDTTVERLLTLNPGLDPVALRIGQRIRVE
jgi:LysM repeat protein